MNKGKELETIQVAAGVRTYFIKVKKSREGMKYIKISASERVDENRYTQRTVIIFEEDIRSISLALNKAFKYFDTAVPINTERMEEATEEEEDEPI